MKSLLSALACAVLAVMGATLAVRAGDAPQQGPIHVTSFFEVNPGGVNQAIGMLKTYRDATRREPGATSVQVYQEVGAPFRLVSLSVWRDYAAYEAHAKAASMAALNQALKAVEYGPADVRPQRRRPHRLWRRLRHPAVRRSIRRRRHRRSHPGPA